MTDICANCKHMVGNLLCGKTSPVKVCKVTGSKSYDTPPARCADVRGDSDQCNLLTKRCSCCLGKGFYTFPDFRLNFPSYSYKTCDKCSGKGFIRD